MGQNFSSEPVIDKDTERDHNDTFNVAVSSCQGWRMSQEDNHSLILDLPGEHKAAFFAVYDGHGSAKVSKHASEDLWRHLVENENYLKGDYKEALESAFLTFDREVNESCNAQLAGTTAVSLLIVENKIYCANIGDSRSVACINCECVPLSYDHKPENPHELKRILAAGGYVLGNRVNGNLALSRAFGDFHYKGNEQLPPDQQIVSPCPDVKIIDLNEDVDFLVLACDGIWDVLSSEEVVEFVISRLESDMELGRICEELTTRCLATDYELVIGCDNMTVLIVCYTRGRSWFDYCTDIFNKNSRRLGESRERIPWVEDAPPDAPMLGGKPDGNNKGEQSTTTTTTTTAAAAEEEEEQQVVCESKKEETPNVGEVSQGSEPITISQTQCESQKGNLVVTNQEDMRDRKGHEGETEGTKSKQVIDKVDDCAKIVGSKKSTDSQQTDGGQNDEDDDTPRCLVKVNEQEQVKQADEETQKSRKDTGEGCKLSPELKDEDTVGEETNQVSARES